MSGELTALLFAAFVVAIFVHAHEMSRPAYRKGCKECEYAAYEERRRWAEEDRRAFNEPPPQPPGAGEGEDKDDPPRSDGWMV